MKIFYILILNYILVKSISHHFYFAVYVSNKYL